MEEIRTDVAKVVQLVLGDPEDDHGLVIPEGVASEVQVPFDFAAFFAIEDLQAMNQHRRVVGRRRGQGLG